MRSYLLIIFTFLLSSCGEQAHEQSEFTQETDSSIIIQEDSLITNEPIDSFLWMGNQKILVQDTAANDLNQGKIIRSWLKEDSLMQFFPKVSRNGDSLLFETVENGLVVLEDIPFLNDDDIDCAFYSFQGDVNGSDFWELFATGYEFHWSVLVSKKTGKMSEMSGRPTFSPDQKWLLTGNTDLEAAFTDNGFELYSLENDEIIEVGHVDPLNWGPMSLKWLNNREILVTAGMIDYSTYDMSFKNVVLTMVED